MVRSIRALRLPFSTGQLLMYCQSSLPLVLSAVGRSSPLQAMESARMSSAASATRWCTATAWVMAGNSDPMAEDNLAILVISVG